MTKVKKAPSAEDLLARVGKKATKKKVAKKADKPILKLNNKLEQDFIEYCRIHHIDSILHKLDEGKKKDINKRIFAHWVKNLWETGEVVNPLVNASKESGEVDATATFIVSGGSRVKIVLPEQDNVDGEDEEEPQDVILETLLAGQDGLTKANALSLVKTELDFTPKTELSRPLNELVQGHYGEQNKFIIATELEKSGGMKVLQYLAAEEDNDGNVLDVPALSEAEYEEIVTKRPKITVKNDFLKRAKKYCKTLAQLEKLFTVLKPVAYVTYTKFGVSDAEDVKNTRIGETVNEFILV